MAILYITATTGTGTLRNCADDGAIIDTRP